MDFNTDFEFYIKAYISSGDYEKILDDQSFIKLLSAIEAEDKGVLNRAIRVEKSITSLVEFLKSEVSKEEEK